MLMKTNAKGQVTLPKSVRDAVGIKPGDWVEVRATSDGRIIIEKAGASKDYRARIEALSRRRLIRGITTDELMKETRGDPALDQPLKPR
jgi:antitoxin PrlF